MAHEHAPAIDRIGRARLKRHFNMSDAAITKWRQTGVPKMHRNTLRMLGAVHGVSVAEITE